MAKSSTAGQTRPGMTAACVNEDDCVAEDGRMKLFQERRFDQWTLSSKEGADEKVAYGDDGSTKFFYDVMFFSNPSAMADGKHFERQNPRRDWEESDVDIAMTLHQIGKIHHRSRRYPVALSA